jgi:hydrogenase maturation protein HypF
MALGYLLAAEALGDPEAGLGATAEEAAAPFLARLDPRELAIVRIQLARDLNAPQASSAGRLFDAAAALLGIRDVVEFEAQAAIDLEEAAGDRKVPVLAWALRRSGGLLVYDPRPTLAELIDKVAAGDSRERLAASFVTTVGEVTLVLLEEARRQTGVRTVCLSGGVFQNRRLAQDLLRDLAEAGFEPFINRLVPVNDGGVSYGQAVIGAARLAAEARRAPAIAPGVGG